MSDEQILRDWLVEKGHIPADMRDTVALNICRVPDWAGDKVSPHQPGEDQRMSDSVNKVEIEGVVKWEPRVFDPREEGQKTITVFAIEWVRPKSDNKKSVFHVKAFGDLAEKLRDENLAQGDTVLVKGSLNESKWKDKKTDEWKNQIEVWPLSVEFVERADGNGGEDFGSDEPAAATEADDDIPF